MSEYYYNYKCSECGFELKGLSRGGILFGDYESEIYRCKECGKVSTISLKYDKPGVINVIPKCPCCSGDVELWNGECPECGSLMEEITLYNNIV